MRDREPNSAPARSSGAPNVSRRDLVRLAVGSGFVAAVLLVNADAIETASAGLTTGEIMIMAGNFKMPAYRAIPTE